MKLDLLLSGLSLAAACLTAPSAAAASPPAMRRIAVLVGANDPPQGRQALRYAHDDASSVADVLERVGSFVPADVHVLLDPHPAEVLAAIDAAGQAVAAGDAMFLFYYSGHSDGQMLFPHGEPIAVADLRTRIEQMKARIRVGILDTCRGGSWTQSKGLSVGPPLDVADLLNVETEGTALMSSSSGVEDAHEASALHGSFFTHHLVAGLRGAADRQGDGEITLQEAYEYARERTVRESARLAVTPQHPSFEIGLRGRQDIVLSVLSRGTSSLSLAGARAPLEIIQLPSGATVADAPAGQAVRVALPPGRYMVRTVFDGRVYTTEVEVRDGQTETVEASQLVPSAADSLALKGPGATRAELSDWTSLGSRRWLLHAGFGMGVDPTQAAVALGPGTQTETRLLVYGSLWYRVTDRLSWDVPWPAFRYRFGDPGRVEVMPFVGLVPESLSFSNGPTFAFRGDVATRFWVAHNQRITVTWGALAPPNIDLSGPGFDLASVVDPFATLGYGYTIRSLVTLGVSGGVEWSLRRGQAGPTTFWEVQDEWLHVGGDVGIRVSPQVALDAHFGWAAEELSGSGGFPFFSVGTTVAF